MRLADPNRNIIGYQSQEVPVESARTSGVFWSTSKTRDNRRFPGAAEKTLLGQSLESVSAEGNRAMLNAEEERDDSLLWSDLPRLTPVNSLMPEAGGSRLFVV